MNLPDQGISQISIIIPTLNEGNSIKKVLPGLMDVPGLETIVVDGGSKDSTVPTVASLGVQVISTPPGRALQMNAGAAAAQGDILLFLHADTTLPHGFDDLIRRVLSAPHVAAGAFTLEIDAPGLKFRVIEWLAHFRSTFFKMPYGDQVLFITAEMFQSVGGFSELPIMEDFEFIRRLRRKGRIQVLSSAALTSPRRWLQLGIIKTTLVNQAIIIGFFLGVDPARLARWYRQAKG